MYIWVILATFITLLYSFNLSVRPDMDRAQAESRAGVMVAKFRTQQQVAKDYFASQETSRTGCTYVSYYPGDGIGSTTGNPIGKTTCNTRITPTPDEGESSENSPSTSGTSSNEDILKTTIDKYLPLGHQLPSHDIAGGNPAISKVFCFSYSGSAMNYNTNCQTPAGEGSCCTWDNSEIYVVTFQKIPARWMNKTTNFPNTDMISALTNAPGYGNAIGYTMKKDEDLVMSGGRKVTKYAQGTASKSTEFEYRSIWKALKDDADFKQLKCDDPDSVRCLIAIQQVYR